MFQDIGQQFSNIKRAIAGAFGYVFEYKLVLGKALLIPFILLLAVSLLEMEVFHGGQAILLTTASAVLHAIFAITTHRVVLLGAGAVPRWGMYRLTGREVRFVLYMIGLGLLMIPVGMLSLIPLIGFVVMLLVIIYLVSRLSLVFPAIATDQPMGFGDSWQATRSHQLFMLVMVGAFPVLLSLPEILLAYVPDNGLLASITSLLTTVFVISALSMAFKIIKESEATAIET